jgi:pimeloyl-ACP methyl ester carboxylesterase
MTTTEPTVGFDRADAPFHSCGVRCAAWHYRPVPAPARPSPVIVMAHGFGGTRGLRLDAYAERFAAAGYQVLLFDYRSFGDSDGQPRQVLDIRRQHADWRAAIDHARSLPDVDPQRIVLWGTSLSGGHVLHLAARDHRLAAVIAQVPHVSGFAASRAVGPVMSLRLGLRGGLDVLRALLKRPPLYIPGSGRPGQVAAMTSDDARPGLERMAAQSSIEEPPREVAARIILQIALYSPGRTAGRITTPTLVQIGRRDVVTPPGPTRRVAARITRGEVREYDLSHFEPYVSPHFETISADQIEFLRRVLD